MKAVFVKEQNRVVVDDVDSPALGDGDMLVKMKACGLCGSDLEKVYGQYGMISKRLGHEPAGEVIQVGKNLKTFSVGDRVFVHHHVPCYSCHYCDHEDYTMCPSYQKSNLDPCGLSEIFLVPEWNVARGGVLRLPDNVSFEEAAMIEPLACCIRAIDKVKISLIDYVAVIGVGPAGIMHLLLARAFNARKVFAADINAFRLEFAKKLGADLTVNPANEDISVIRDATDGRGVDISIVAAGSTSALQTGLDITRSGGKVVLFGVPPKGMKSELDLNNIYSREIDLIPSYAASEKETNFALELIRTKRIDIASIITHRFKLEEAMNAVQCAHEAKDAMKVIVIT